MNQADLDKLVTKVINRAREGTGDMRTFILGGGLDQRDYDKMTGELRGMERILQSLIEEADKYIKEALDGEE